MFFPRGFMRQRNSCEVNWCQRRVCTHLQGYSQARQNENPAALFLCCGCPVFIVHWTSHSLFFSKDLRAAYSILYVSPESLQEDTAVGMEWFIWYHLHCLGSKFLCVLQAFSPRLSLDYIKLHSIHNKLPFFLFQGLKMWCLILHLEKKWVTLKLKQNFWGLRWKKCSFISRYSSNILLCYIYSHSCISSKYKLFLIF